MQPWFGGPAFGIVSAMLFPVCLIGPIVLQIKLILASLRCCLLSCLALAPGLAAQAAAAFEDSMAQRSLACTGCHGAQGQAGPDGYYPRLAGKPAAYLYNQLQNFRQGRRHYPLMQGLLEPLDDAYLQSLAAHFAGLSVPYAPPARTTASAAELALGRRLVLQGDSARGLPACTQCHGQQLTGVLPATPGLLGLPADYINAQLGGWQTGQRHAAAPDCMAAIARQLQAGESTAIARWLAAQTVPAQAQAVARMPSPLPTAADRSLRCGSDTPAAPASTSTTTGNTSARADAAQVARGAYLARIGNCAQCHSQRGGLPYGGGRAVDTPFGAVYSSNLTPERRHGIGSWSADDFWRALHHGLSKDGRALSPAFPYTSYTRLTRSDSDALFAFLQSLPASSQANTAPALRWPYGTQWALRAWRALYFTPAETTPGPAPATVPAEQSAAWQRGQYLVQGLGHCLECHSARNWLGARTHASAVQGAVLPGSQWFAPSLNDPAGASVAAWSEASIRTYLQTGSNAEAQASGPMAAVVLHGTQYLSDADAQAMAVYLKALPQSAPAPQDPPAAASSSKLQQGARLYGRHCADCHGAQGQGRAGAYPALAGNRTVTQQPANNLIHSVLQGGFAAATRGHPQPYGMPPFLLQLSDAELAALLSHVRSSWGNRAAALSEFDINTFRRSQAP